MSFLTRYWALYITLSIFICNYEYTTVFINQYTIYPICKIQVHSYDGIAKCIHHLF